MTTITLTSTDALLAAKTALANCSAEDITPVICAARFKLVGGRLEVTATDRYTVSRHSVAVQTVNAEKRLEPTKPEGELEAIVPRAALLWLTRNANAFGKTMFGGKVELDFHLEEPDRTVPKVKPTAGHVTITVSPIVGEREALAATFPLTAGNFPPVQRLIEEATPAVLGVMSLSPSQLAKLNKFIPPHVPVRFEFTDSPRKGQAGPIRWTVADLQIDGLLQPNLLVQ